jgi:hypothetical protein
MVDIPPFAEIHMVAGLLELGFLNTFGKSSMNGQEKNPGPQRALIHEKIQEFSQLRIMISPCAKTDKTPCIRFSSI